MLLIVLIGILLFGSRKLPELGRAVGRTLHEFRAGTKQLTEELDEHMLVTREAARSETKANIKN